MTSSKRTGFTLIELLVVIAIIGILSSVVLASLSTARSKSADAAVKSVLSSARSQAELYASSNNGYGTAGAGAAANVCGAATGMKAQLDNAISNAASGATIAANCFVTADGWAASLPLKGTTGAYYCVDSSGAATTTSALGISTSDVSC